MGVLFSCFGVGYFKVLVRTAVQIVHSLSATGLMYLESQVTQNQRRECNW